MKTEMMLYNEESKTGKNIQYALDVYCTRGNEKGYNMINWGCGTQRKLRFKPENWLNKREAVDVAKNKLSTLQVLKSNNVSVPAFTIVSPEVDDDIWYARESLTSCGGQGIKIIKPNDLTIPEAPLYTKQVKGDREYRVHVFNGEVIAISSKEMNPSSETVNQFIKNHDNGWYFKQCSIDQVHEEAQSLAKDAVDVLGLDFGAVDMVYDRSERNGWVLEVNTAPGLDPDCHIFPLYVEKIKEWIQSNQEDDNSLQGNYEDDPMAENYCSREHYDICITEKQHEKLAELLDSFEYENGECWWAIE